MKRQEQIIIQRNPDQPKIICNKVSKRFLNLSESVSLGLEPEPSISDFVVKKELGRGSFGQVFLAMHKKTKVYYAIKQIDKRNKNNEDGKPYFRREIEIMYKIKHPNCVRLFGNFEDEINCYFIMEYIPKGNLYNFILSNKNKGLDKVLVATIMRELINAIHYLHSMSPPIIHRDIKPENILLTNNNKIKLTDFGWANYINFQDEQRNTFCGTPLYLSPEMIENKGHGKYVDIWCLGVLLFELLVGVPPFYGKDRAMLIKNIMKVHILWPKCPKKEIDKDAKDLISKILVLNPKQRISLEDMVKHPFFTKNLPDVPPYLEKSNQYHNKPFIISKDIPDEENYDTNIITTKKIKLVSDISENKKKLSDFNTKNIVPGSYLEKKNLYIKNLENHNDNSEILKNKIIKINIENYSKDKNTKKLINNRSATNFFTKKPYKKKLYKNNEQNYDYNELLKKIEEYKKRDNEKNLKIEELLSKNTYLNEENEYLNRKLKEKEEELKQKENRIKILESKLFSNKLSTRDKKIFNINKIIRMNISQSPGKENNNNNFFFQKNNKYTSRTPDASPTKFRKRKKIIPSTNTKPYMKKNILINNIIDNDDSDKNKNQESFCQYEINVSSTNISSLDNQEIEILRKEFNKEKEKHENDINNFIKEIRILQNENTIIKEKEKNEINKLTRHLTENEKEIKKWKEKVKELEMKFYEKK